MNFVSCERATERAEIEFKKHVFDASRGNLRKLRAPNLQALDFRARFLSRRCSGSLFIDLDIYDVEHSFLLLLHQ